MGCPNCVCAAAGTLIATPEGDRPIDSLRVGDMVYSVDRGSTSVVTIAAINRARVHHHTMVRIDLSTGATIELSAGHPTADGRFIGDLKIGDELGGSTVVGLGRVPYDSPFTYDILPDSDTGFYFAGGALIGSTLRGAGFGAEPAAPLCPFPLR